MEDHNSNIQQNSPATRAVLAGARMLPDAPAFNDSRAHVANNDLAGRYHRP